MNGFRFGMAMAAIALLPAGSLLAQQPNPPAGQNQAPANATKPASGPGAPGVTPSRRDEPGSSSSTKETPPIAGANSFTESQARERIAKAGYSSVKSLQMDAQGIWRGNAQKAGKDVGVALDYRGNVVQQ